MYAVINHAWKTSKMATEQSRQGPRVFGQRFTGWSTLWVGEIKLEPGNPGSRLIVRMPSRLIKVSD